MSEPGADPIERICRLMRRMEGYEEQAGFEGEPTRESFQEDDSEILGQRNERDLLPSGLFVVKPDS